MCLGNEIFERDVLLLITSCFPNPQREIDDFSGSVKQHRKGINCQHRRTADGVAILHLRCSNARYVVKGEGINGQVDDATQRVKFAYWAVLLSTKPKNRLPAVWFS